jgi:putative oligomerization/nucleic acid binding protein
VSGRRAGHRSAASTPSLPAVPGPQDPPAGTARRVTGAAVLCLGVAAGAAAVTLLSRMMRAVTAVGGSCADGGPYVSAQPCPDGTGAVIGLLFVLVPLFLGGTWWGAHTAGAPNPVLLGWPALFLTLGWHFLDDGFDPPPGAEGISVGYVVCGVVFVLMGAAPLLLALLLVRDRRRTRAAQAGAPPVVTPYPHLRDRPPPSRECSEPDLPAGDDPGASVTGRLERLARLHASGALTDEEFRAAKAATLREGAGR